MENEETRLSLILTKKFRKEYKLYCLNENKTMSERLRKLMELDLAGKIKE